MVQTPADPSRFLIDTDVLIDYLRGVAVASAWLEQVEGAPMVSAKGGYPFECAGRYQLWALQRDGRRAWTRISPSPACFSGTIAAAGW